MEDKRNTGCVNGIIDQSDPDNPVPGSAADVAKRQRKGKIEKLLKENKETLDSAAENFPVFGRIMELVMQKED